MNKKCELNASGSAVELQITRDSSTFHGREEKTLVEMEKKLQDDLRKRRKEWERQVQRMKDEFLFLYPVEREWGSEELLNDPRVARRKGSTDVLDHHKMKTMFMDYPDVGRRFKLRFDLTGFEPASVLCTLEKDRISIRADKVEEENGQQKRRAYQRRVEIPREVDMSKLHTRLTSDHILIVEAPLPPHSLLLMRSQSPSHSSSGLSSPGSGSPKSPFGNTKMGTPMFQGKGNDRCLSLIIELGKCFMPREVNVQVIKDNRIIVKAKHEERTSERMSKSKFSKEYELQEKIDPHSLRAGLSDDGRLIIAALGKHHNAEGKEAAKEALSKEIKSNATPCTVFDLATFPPTSTTE